MGMVLLFVLVAASCAPRRGAAPPPVDTTDRARQAEAWRNAAEGMWTARGDRDRLEGVLARYEQAWTLDPTNRAVAARLAEGWFLRGELHEQDREAKMAAFERSASWAARCLALNTAYAALVERKDETLITALRATSGPDVPCLYWSAWALDTGAKATGVARALKLGPTARAQMARVEELEPDYHYHGADRFFGAWLATLPRFAGQDLERARARLERAVEGSPLYLDNSVVLAESWAVRAGDRAAFREALERVVSADPDALPQASVENRAARAHAGQLLAQIDELFPASAGEFE